MRLCDPKFRHTKLFRRKRPRVRWGAAWIIFAAVLAQAEFVSAMPVGVLLIGDSITQGLVSGPSGVDHDCGQGRCYAERLKASLGEGYSVVNAGVGGATTMDWVPGAMTFPYVLVEAEPTGLFEALARPRLPADLVVVMLGVNDAIGFLEAEPVSPSRYRENLSQMIGAIIDGGVSRILLVKPSPLFGFDAVTRQRLVDYGSKIDLLCSLSKKVVCGPDLLALLTPADFEGNDVHPNADGHAKIAAALVEQVGSIPEPTTALLLGLGLIGLVWQPNDRRSF